MDGLVPKQVRQMVEKYRDDMSVYISTKLDNLESESTINKFLSDNNLPFCVESSSGKDGIPDSLFNKLSQIKTKGGTEFILSQLDLLNKKNSEISEKLREILKTINLEEEEDNKLRQEHQNKWTRAPSNSTNMSFKQSLIDYTSKLDAASKCDLQTKSQIQDNCKFFELICLEREKLNEKIPIKSETTNLSGSEDAKIIRDLINEMDSKKSKMMKEIDLIFSNLNSGEINSQFIKVLQKKSTEQNIFNEKKSEYDEKFKSPEELSSEIKQIKEIILEKMVNFNKMREDASKLGESNETVRIFFFFLFFFFFCLYLLLNKYLSFSSLRSLMAMRIYTCKN